MNGILIVNKEKGVTSRDVVNDICHIFGTKKVGHTGTLDPIAQGVLVITLGKYTKLCDDLTSTFKEYIAEMKLGVSTDTLDITGNVIKEEKVELGNSVIIEGIKSFKGKYEQEVPIYSSVKVNGKKLYDYARAGETVELPKREVEIKEIEVLEIKDDIVTFKCLVSKGTYIRSLIRDIGDSLNIPTTMNNLIRTKQGIFDIEDSYTIEEIRNNEYKLLDLEDVLDIDVIECDDILYKKISSGVKQEKDSNKEYTLYKYKNNNVALYKNNKMYIYFEL
jgi:tRNA pseudouridine55 synthase